MSLDDGPVARVDLQRGLGNADPGRSHVTAQREPEAVLLQRVLVERPEVHELPADGSPGLEAPDGARLVGPLEGRAGKDRGRRHRQEHGHQRGRRLQNHPVPAASVGSRKLAAGEDLHLDVGVGEGNRRVGQSEDRAGTDVERDVDDGRGRVLDAFDGLFRVVGLEPPGADVDLALLGAALVLRVRRAVTLRVEVRSRPRHVHVRRARGCGDRRGRSRRHGRDGCGCRRGAGLRRRLVVGGDHDLRKSRTACEAQGDQKTQGQDRRAATESSMQVQSTNIPEG